jgi:xylulokinase
MSGVLLGIDVGTSSSKGLLASPDGEVLAEAEQAHQVSRPREGWAEMDAIEIWWGDFLALCAELLPQTSDGVDCVCVSGVGPCLLAADANGQPLRPAILYGIDSRAQREIEELSSRYGAELILERCHSPLTSQAVGPKIAWLHRHEAEVWERTRRWFMPSSFLVHRLTGEYILDHHSASQSDPLYDVDRFRFIEEWAQEIAPGLELPRLLWPAEIAGAVTRAAAKQTGLAEGTPVAAGTIDAWAEASSVGVEEPQELMLMYGSTFFIVAVTQLARSHPALWGTAGVREGSRCLAAGMATSGSITDWLRRLLGDPPFERLLKQAEEVSPGAEGLLLLPYFAGERTPLFDPAARGVLCGLTLRHGAGHMYRAVLEGVACGVRHNLEVIEQSGERPERIVAAGGGVQGGLWTQIVSDVTGRTQEIPRRTVGACYGDALLAGRACGLVSSDTNWFALADRVQPREHNRERYEELYRLYRELYPATRAIAHSLARHQREEMGDG